jgi:hypothetical protein
MITISKPTPPAPLPPAQLIVGADLGAVHDPTAVSVSECSWVRRPDGRPVPEFAIRHLFRFPLGTSYVDIVKDIAELVKRPPLVNPLLALDQTGVGRPIVDMFRAAQVRARLRPIVITAGASVTAADDGATRAPKKLLASLVQRALQERRVRCADLPERALLLDELAAFSVKVSPEGVETYEALRARDADDLVLSIAMTIFTGSQPPTGPGLVGGTRPLFGVAGQPLETRAARAEAARAERLAGPPRLWTLPPWQGG